MTNKTRHIVTTLILFLTCNILFAQMSQTDIFSADSLLVIEKNTAKGFHNDYILFIPKGTKLHKQTFLLVEPNNTGKLSDSIEVHKEHAIFLATKNSVGNNISTELKIPILVPIFPRPASKPLIYTHALDRDVILEKSTNLKRLDLQLLEMINDARNVLKTMNIIVADKVFMSGFSASATFINRFSFLHPAKIKALAIGGFNGILMLPQNEINSVKLNYPIGTNDFEKLFKQKFDFETYKSIPQFIYMGELDDNDAVQYDDAYNKKERKIINDNIGATIQKRYLECQKVYLKVNINATFKTYEKVGHWTTSNMNLEVIKFFLAQMKQNGK
ncbi:hypothetical protein SAMN04488541_10876 [Thermoflexibacter ruber]|uniref:Alpha/beta hydrolase family protein n=2 Tax=Thermoflexibacter ruber TaxID=1003 RepID=A0A1I2K4L1_9BACT|nr:hypothetical protein SAMN04488541_10876 [Thermoflexibacter ruber]